MNTPRRTRAAADVIVAYAADAKGNGIAYATIAGAASVRTIRLSFFAKPIPALDGREQGYAAVTAVGLQLKGRGFGRVRIRVADAQVAADLNGSGAPPKALAMAYVRTRCVLHGLGSVRLEVVEPVEIQDLTTRVAADVCLHAAA